MPDADAEERFRTLYDQHYVQVLGYLTRRVGPDAAQDALAETFLTAWRQLDRVPANALPWLYRVAANVLNNQRRKDDRQAHLRARAQTEAGTGRPAVSGDSGDHADRVVEGDRVRAALRRLPPRDQEVLRLMAWEDLDVATAAQAMGCSVTAMKVRLFRARRRMAKFLLAAPGSAEAEAEGERQRVAPDAARSARTAAPRPATARSKGSL